MLIHIAMEEGHTTSTKYTDKDDATIFNDLCVQKDVLGCVKWFNSKVGYGFITNLDTGDEIFAHHSNIKSDTETFRYLVQGEYVQFKISHVARGNTSIHATEITGVRGGKLLCDVHQSRKVSTPIATTPTSIRPTPYRSAALKHAENEECYGVPLDSIPRSNDGYKHANSKEYNHKRQFRLPTSK